MKLLSTLLTSLLLLTGCAQGHRASATWEGDKQVLHVKHTKANLDVKLSSTEPGRVVLKVIDSTGRPFQCGFASDRPGDQVTEIIFDAVKKKILINGEEHPYHKKGHFLVKDNKLIEM